MRYFFKPFKRGSLFLALFFIFLFTLTLVYLYNDDWLLFTGILLALLLTLLSFFLLREHRRLTQALAEAHRANEKLSCQESLLRAIYDSSGLSLLLLDSQRNILYANQCVADLFQRSPAEVLGTDYCLYLAPNMREESKRNFEQALRHPHQPVFAERSHQLPNGTTIWYRAASRAFLDQEGKASGVVIVVEDITERRREEASLRLAHTVFDTSPVAIVVTDAQHRIVSANNAYLRISGYTLAEVLGEKKDDAPYGSAKQRFLPRYA